MATKRARVELHHFLEGTGDPALVFVPGWCCDHTFFQPQIDYFKATHRVLAFDPRGCGRSDAPDDGYDIPTLAADVAWLVAQAGIDRPVIVGHSLGGMVAVEVAASRPGLAAAVVALDPGPFDMLPDARAYYTAFAEQLEGPEGDVVRRAFIDLDFLPTDEPTRRRWIIEKMMSVPLPIAASMIRELLRWDGASALARTTCPLLVIRATPVGGSNDPQRLRALKPEVQIGVTVGSGHFHQLELADQVNSMMERFLHLLPAS